MRLQDKSKLSDDPWDHSDQRSSRFRIFTSSHHYGQWLEDGSQAQWFHSLVSRLAISWHKKP